MVTKKAKKEVVKAVEVKEEVKEKRALTKTQQEWWDSIKNVEVNYYGLPDHFVHTVCEPVNIIPDALFLETKGPAVISIVTEALADKGHHVKTASGKKLPKFVLDLVENNLITLKPNPDLALKDYK